MHSWRLNLNTLAYDNSHVCKEPLDYQTIDKKHIILPKQKRSLKNPYLSDQSSGECSVRWLNHASVYFKCDEISILTDPWLFGPAFMTGWWLSEPSAIEAVELLKNVDYIFISHNHPDHLHPETLSLIEKNKPIIVADFTTKSTEKFLSALGFTNIIPLPFNTIYKITTNVQISVLKSGDFRDDSGLYLSLNRNQMLLTVDSNILNANVLPQDIDLLMTSFAGGASGFPLCFENYTNKEKQAITRRNKLAIRSSVISYLEHTKPKNYMPYAGMFAEYAERDQFILQSNAKNSAQTYQSIAEQAGANFIKPEKNKVLFFKKGILQIKQIQIDLLPVENYQFYIDQYKHDYPYSSKKIIAYLEKSEFYGNHLVQFIPTNDDFDQIVNDIIYADFKNQKFQVITEENLISSAQGIKVMKLFIRAEVLACIVENKLPWEDFSIGFQMRVERSPNEYESDLWYHFTNNLHQL